MKRLFTIALASMLFVPLIHAQQTVVVPSNSQQQTVVVPGNQDPTVVVPAQGSTVVVPEDQRHPVAVFKVNVVQRTTEAINYRYRSGATHVNFRGTELMPKAEGKARVQSAAGKMDIQARLEHLQPPSNFGPEYLTYVLWAITPEGRAVNLGELIYDDGHADLHTAADLQAFGLIVTAEPYFAVTRPSNLMIAENLIRKDTEGWAQHIDAKFDLLERGSYLPNLRPEELPATRADRKHVPLQLLEAQNAVAIAKATGAERWAPDVLAKAQTTLDQAESYLAQKQHTNVVGTAARQAAQMAEDARVLTLRHREEARVAAERRALEDSTARAQAEALARQREAERESQRRAQAEADRAAAEQARTQAEQARQSAEAAARQAALERQQADAARAAAEQQQAALQQQTAQAQADAQRAEQARLQAEHDREQIRARLVSQLNQVLQTRDTAQGVIVTMPDVLFDFNKSTLKPTARERLAKVAGIILAYPDIKLNVEGFTDAIGSEQYNQVLSEKRAASVREYLVSQGVNIDNVMAQGFGKSNPVASNATAEGRQLNRRVELVVTGESIGRYAAPVPPNEVVGSPATTTLPQSTQPPSSTLPPRRTIPPQ